MYPQAAQLKDHERELRAFQLRVGIAAIAVLAAFAVLFARFFYLQVVQHELYAARAEDNRISIVPLAPNRGLILDRNGVVLARNYSAYTLEVAPARVRDLERTIGELAEIVDIQPRDRARLRRLLAETRSADSLPIRTRLSDEEVARFAANRYPLSGCRDQGAAVPPVSLRRDGFARDRLHRPDQHPRQ
jgi:penicillin-binding protein 2